VTCIEKYGIDKLTTRKIAKEAGTNIASINYYFRSKEQLVTETLSMTINHMMEDVIAAIEEPDQSFEQRLMNVFFYLLDGSFRFPGVSTAHLYSAVVEKRYDSPGAQAITKVFDRIVVCALREYPSKNPDDLRFLLSQIFSSIMFTMMAPDFFPMVAVYQSLDSDKCKALAERYVRIFVGSIQ
jgi:AcrR family transcriptional regulator